MKSDTIVTASSLDELRPVLAAAAAMPGHGGPALLTEAETDAVSGGYIGSNALIAMTSSCMGGALPK